MCESCCMHQQIQKLPNYLKGETFELSRMFFRAKSLGGKFIPQIHIYTPLTSVVVAHVRNYSKETNSVLTHALCNSTECQWHFTGLSQSRIWPKSSVHKHLNPPLSSIVLI